MQSIKKWLYKPKKGDSSLLAQFYYADEDLAAVTAELDSFDGRKDPERCAMLVAQLRQSQDRVLNIINEMMDETVGAERTNRDFRVKYPDDVLQENLAGQLWFGAECLAAGSNILNRELESAEMRPLAKAVIKTLDRVRSMLREQCMSSCPDYTEMIRENFKIFDRLLAEFEFTYVSTMVPVKTIEEYDIQLNVTVLFSETLQRAVRLGLVLQEGVDDCDPALMFTIPRLAIVGGLLIFPNGPLNVDGHPSRMSELFRPFRNLLRKIREVLWTLNKDELCALEKALCSTSDPGSISVNVEEGEYYPLERKHDMYQDAMTDAQITGGLTRSTSDESFSSSLSHSTDTMTSICTSLQDVMHVSPCHEHQSHHSRVPVIPCASAPQITVSEPTSPESSCDECSAVASPCNYHCSLEVPLSDSSSSASEGMDEKGRGIPLPARAAELVNQREIRAKFKDSEDLIHRLFVCISGVGDQLQTNFAGDLRNILKAVFVINATPSEEESSASLDQVDGGNEDEQSIDSAEEAQDMGMDLQIGPGSSFESSSNSASPRESNSFTYESAQVFPEVSSSTQQTYPSIRSNRIDVVPSGNVPIPVTRDDHNSVIVDSNTAYPHSPPALMNMPTLRNNMIHYVAAQESEPTDVQMIQPLTAPGGANRAPLRSKQPPEWVPDELAPFCMGCEATFTVIRRRHHCRNCGKVFCSKCCSNAVPLPHYGHQKPVRVCNRCFLYSVTPFTVNEVL
ncbi:unnamed protein product [Darwinula stevensoni]|uniref:Lateral signaling target protein 2 homolog n=1 Tax=Darwinula stevensoni TaxID=69355 RepID=A0A7R8X390_9CRUS|nr:unnamed protein product [Darwinula stevensoni]CAG0878534.1 unnamed protein product [Darwinula stevensoni]